MISDFIAERRRSRNIRSWIRDHGKIGPRPFAYTVLAPHPKVGYLPVPKAANTSIRIALLPLCGADAGALKRPSKVHKFEALNKSQAVEGYPGLDEDAYIFTVVRHPAERLLSAWKNKVRSMRDFGPAKAIGLRPWMSFDAFLETIASVPKEMLDSHFRMQSLLLSEPLKAPKVKVIKMENLDEDWPAISSQIETRSGIALGPLESFNVTGAAEAHRFTKRQRHLIEYCHGADFENFGYGWDAEGQPCLAT